MAVNGLWQSLSFFSRSTLMTMISSIFSFRSQSLSPKRYSRKMVIPPAHINNNHRNHKTMQKNYARIKIDTIQRDARIIMHMNIYIYICSFCFSLLYFRLSTAYHPGKKASIRMNFNLIICDGLRVSVSVHEFFTICPFLFHLRARARARTCIQFCTESFGWAGGWTIQQNETKRRWW